MQITTTFTLLAFDGFLLADRTCIVDRVVVVSAALDVQRARVLARSGMTPAKLDAILARQLPDAAKRARADFVIPTDVPLAETRAAVARVVACLRASEG